jgi:hypothetical protein
LQPVRSSCIGSAIAPSCAGSGSTSWFLPA